MNAILLRLAHWSIAGLLLSVHSCLWAQNMGQQDCKVHFRSVWMSSLDVKVPLRRSRRTVMRHLLLVPVLLLVCLLTTFNCHAQSSGLSQHPAASSPTPSTTLGQEHMVPGDKGAISGKVTDQKHAAVSYAKVVLSSLGANLVIPINDRGEYSVTGLYPGTYNLTFSAAGFADKVFVNVTLTPGQQLTINALLKPASAPTKVNAATASVPEQSERSLIRDDAKACRDRMKELADSVDHLDALTNEKLGAVQKEINDCVYAESGGLSKGDILRAYKLRDASGKEVMKRVAEAAQKTVEEDQKLRDGGRILAQGYVDQNKAYRELIDKYNSLVGSYNSLVREYKSNLADTNRFVYSLQSQLKSMSYACEVNNLVDILSSIPQKTPPVISAPPSQIYCTTENMPAAVPGLSSWSYTSCH